MMEKLFLSILNMSITASWVILAIVIARFAMRRFPAKYSYVLWAVAGFRLLCPFSISSAVSLFNLKNFSAVRAGNQMEYIPMDIGYARRPEVDLGTAAVNTVVNGSLPTGNAATSVNPLQIWIFLGTWIWIIGMGILLIYAFVSLLRTAGKVSMATHFCENVYECENIPSPFVLGVIRPKIYIPYRLSSQEQEYILAHERFHIRRFDHWVKILAFLLVIVHWFNPFVWGAFFLMGQDMEMSCDEAVISKFGKDVKKDYSTLLLSFSENHRHFSPGPLAFGESDVAQRIKNVLRFQNPKVWMSILGIAAVAVIAAACMTNGSKEQGGDAADKGEDAASENAVENIDAAGENASESVENAADSMEMGNVEEEINAMVESQLQRWAIAFCDRDGETILEMCTDEAEASFAERELLFVGEEAVSFGMSSPWPWQSGADYMILAPVDNTAEILYYAQTSDPHVTVWRETLHYQVLDEEILVEAEELKTLDHICSMEEFLLAYPRGINGTEMDYLANGMGEALNSNAMLSSGLMYQDLFEPASAAISLLNLLDNPNKVQIREHAVSREDGVEIQIYFAEDGGIMELMMVQPYGENGIWIPQDLQETKEPAVDQTAV